MKRLALFICTLLCANVLFAQAEFIVGNLKYEVSSSNPTEVSVGKVDNTITTANIPTTVSYNGTTYSVTSIRYEAFKNCSSLTSVTIPNSVTFIGGNAFYSCSSLTSVTIPNSVASIVSHVFDFCSSLTSVDIPNSVTSIGSYAFAGCSSLTSVTIPDSVTAIYEYTFNNCSSLTSITIPNSVTSIGKGAFSGCSDLTYIILGESVDSIGKEAFESSTFLQEITCLATNPPTLFSNSFPHPNMATLTVPCGSLDAYTVSTSYWNILFNGRISEDGYEVVANVNNDAFGSVAVESDCSSATLTATANEGYEFAIWSDGNTENPRIVALSSDTTFTAIFAEINETSLMEVVDTELSFYPNPTKGKVTFNETIERLDVMDLSGKCVLSYNNVKEIDIESLPAGVYYLRLYHNDKAIVRKIIKD